MGPHELWRPSWPANFGRHGGCSFVNQMPGLQNTILAQKALSPRLKVPSNDLTRTALDASLIIYISYDSSRFLWKSCTCARRHVSFARARHIVKLNKRWHYFTYFWGPGKSPRSYLEPSYSPSRLRRCMYWGCYNSVWYMAPDCDS